MDDNPCFERQEVRQESGNSTQDLTSSAEAVNDVLETAVSSFQDIGGVDAGHLFPPNVGSDGDGHGHGKLPDSSDSSENKTETGSLLEMLLQKTEMSDLVDKALITDKFIESILCLEPGQVPNVPSPESNFFNSSKNNIEACGGGAQGKEGREQVKGATTQIMITHEQPSPGEESDDHVTDVEVERRHFPFTGSDADGDSSVNTGNSICDDNVVIAAAADDDDDDDFDDMVECNVSSSDLEMSVTYESDLPFGLFSQSQSENEYLGVFAEVTIEGSQKSKNLSESQSLPPVAVKNSKNEIQKKEKKLKILEKEAKAENVRKREHEPTDLNVNDDPSTKRHRKAAASKAKTSHRKKTPTPLENLKIIKILKRECEGKSTTVGAKTVQRQCRKLTTTPAEILKTIKKRNCGGKSTRVGAKTVQHLRPVLFGKLCPCCQNYRSTDDRLMLFHIDTFHDDDAMFVRVDEGDYIGVDSSDIEHFEQVKNSE